MFDTYEELDFVRDRVAPGIEADIEAEQKLKVLNWSDAGWVHTFTTVAVRSPDELRQIRLMCAAGDPDTEALYKRFGYRVVPLPYSDVLVSLETGLVQAVQGPPLYALLEQWFAIANHMIEMRWAPLVGATLIRLDTWERIDPAWREDMLAAAHRAGFELRSTIRRLGDDAVPEMQARGLSVVRLSPAERLVWKQEVERTYPSLRGSFAPADLLDEVLRLRDEYRRAGAGG